MKRILYLESRSSLSDFAEACLALTPKIHLYRERELYLDLAPTEKALGGETGQLLCLENLLESFAFDGKLVAVDRPEWARPLATQPVTWIPRGESHARLLSLPIDRLPFCGDPAEVDEKLPELEKLAQFMRRVGIKHLRDFTRLQPSAIGRRFGKLGARLHDWVMGKREVSLPLFEPPERIVEEMPTEEIASLEALLFCLRQILIRIEARLTGRSRMVKQLLIELKLESGKSVRKHLTLAQPLVEATEILKLLREYLNKMKWDSPLAHLRVEVAQAIPKTEGQLSLFDRGENRLTDLGKYIERLRARFGETAVGFPELKESYRPERSWKNVWPPRPSGLPRQSFPHRPLFLYTPPRPASPKPNWHLTPSENLAAEWWDEGGYRRYFVAETPRGEKLWIFLDGSSREWFLHGTFD